MLKAEAARALEKIGNHEEVFVLRAQDALFASTVRFWAHHAAEAGSPTSKVNEALACADAGAKFEPKKIPD